MLRITPLVLTYLLLLLLALFPLFTLGSRRHRRHRRHARSKCNKLVRTISGRCTNPSRPSWAQAGTAQGTYFSLSNTQPTGKTLPSARLLSNILCAQTADVPSRARLSELVVFFSQFLDHDLLASIDNKKDPLPIPVPSDDAFLSQSTLTFHRSFRSSTGKRGKSRPKNFNSGALDLSMIYGSDDKRARLLRLGERGLLKHSKHDLLQVNTFALRNAPNASSKAFFFSGDHRANEHPVLTSLHIIFSREHNRLAREIATARPTWTDEKLFQAARRVNIAQMQYIVFEEFVPVMVGRPLPPYRGFMKHVDPSPTVLFSTAAFRIGHSMVSSTLGRLSSNGKMSKSSLLKNFFRPAMEFEAKGGVEPLLRAAIKRRAQQLDLKIVDGLRNGLFKGIHGMVHFDLAAMNIQRGRDHALPRYNEIRQVFGLRAATRFKDISSDRQVRRRLRQAYGSVRKVEAWPGMLAEDHVGKAAFGELLVRTWIREFEDLRDGDSRYWRRRKGLRGLGFLKSVGMLRRGEFGMRMLVLRNSRVQESEIDKDVWHSDGA